MNELAIIEKEIMSEKNSRSQIVNLSLDKAWKTHRKYLPYAFTKQDLSILSDVIKMDINSFNILGKLR